MTHSSIVAVALAQGNPSDLKKLGVNKKMLGTMKQQKKMKKETAKEKVTLNGLKKRKMKLKGKVEKLGKIGKSKLKVGHQFSLFIHYNELHYCETLTS